MPRHRRSITASDRARSPSRAERVVTSHSQHKLHNSRTFGEAPRADRILRSKYARPAEACCRAVIAGMPTPFCKDGRALFDLRSFNFHHEDLIHA